MKTGRALSSFVKQLVCITMVIIIILPIMLTFFASIKTGADMVNTSPLLPPPVERVTGANYAKVLGDKNLITGFKNTLVILAFSLELTDGRKVTFSLDVTDKLAELAAGGTLQLEGTIEIPAPTPTPPPYWPVPDPDPELTVGEITITGWEQVDGGDVDAAM